MSLIKKKLVCPIVSFVWWTHDTDIYIVYIYISIYLLYSFIKKKMTWISFFLFLWGKKAIKITFIKWVIMQDIHHLLDTSFNLLLKTLINHFKQKMHLFIDIFILPKKKSKKSDIIYSSKTKLFLVL